MGKALDFYLALTVEKRWKAARVILGPGKSTFSGLHPDVIKALLKAGSTIIFNSILL